MTPYGDYIVVLVCCLVAFIGGYRIGSLMKTNSRHGFIAEVCFERPDGREYIVRMLVSYLPRVGHDVDDGPEYEVLEAHDMESGTPIDLTEQEETEVFEKLCRENSL